MEPLSAFALSGNVLQFIDSASKLISEARRVCQSASGITAGNQDAIAVYNDFRAAAAGLASRTADDAAVVALADRCQELSDELVQGLRNLQAKHPGSRRESLRVAWRALKDKGKLDSLEKRLDCYCQQLVTRIIFMMRLLDQWTASSAGVKICVSSRPYSAFEYSFVTEPERYLRLHEYT
ncbi:hypothetical protein N658DRAFT_326336 [Parathielavia hyrcaniae]|uniref:Fungal N-terminal domain-containing protein n=1 Tax=Parathielavia hyrcaniae TaxID=113614 RepID=A0AAN6T2X6_9PEZI|nr:hypothetical protein N658DRAFT_326336 [Parathielavia hyrcaniae]